MQHNIDDNNVPTPPAPRVIECNSFLINAVFAGMSSDLPEPNSCRRFEALGKYVLLPRDSKGNFRAFEIRCVPDSSGKKMIHVCVRSQAICRWLLVYV